MPTALKKVVLPKICAITPPQDANLFEKVAAVLKAGIRWIQYRQKDKSRRELYNEALALHKLTKKHHALLTINDYVDIALAIGAEGVHLGQEDIPFREARRIIPAGMILGVSTHTLQEAQEAQREGADYIGFGPVFETTTKDAGSPKGIDLVKTVSERIDIPVIAIGGINMDNIAALLYPNSKIHGAAISSGLFKGDIIENCNGLTQKMQLEKLIGDGGLPPVGSIQLHFFG